MLFILATESELLVSSLAAIARSSVMQSVKRKEKNHSALL